MTAETLVASLIVCHCLSGVPAKDGFRGGKGWVAWDVVVTAYCPCEKCCGQFADGRTASGAKAEGRTIAAPKFVPFGTVIYVPGYGLASVEDRGAAIQGNRLDVLYKTHAEAMRFGCRKATVWVYDPTGAIPLPAQIAHARNSETPPAPTARADAHKTPPPVAGAETQRTLPPAPIARAERQTTPPPMPPAPSVHRAPRPAEPTRTPRPPRPTRPDAWPEPDWTTFASIPDLNDLLSALDLDEDVSRLIAETIRRHRLRIPTDRIIRRHLERTRILVDIVLEQ